MPGGTASSATIFTSANGSAGPISPTASRSRSRRSSTPLRPAAALRWLRLHPEARIAPMHFPTLIREAEPPLEVLRISEALIARKAVTRELGTAPLPGPVEHFIDAEFALAHAAGKPNPARITADARSAAESFFRETVRRLASTSAGAGAR